MMNGIATGVLVCAIIFITKTDQTNSQTIDGLSNVNSTAGKNITITWLIRNIQNTLVMGFYINNTANANKLASFTTTNVETSEEISFSSPSFDVIKRARLYYTYVGEFHGNKTGRITLQISKLKLTDTNGYILEFTLDHNNTFTTMLNVNYGPKKCGAGLKPEYPVTGKEKWVVTMDICGKPQPRVTCTLAGQTNKVTANITSVNAAHNYTFTASIPTDIDACDRKRLQCVASGVAGNFSQTTLVVRKCKSTHISYKTRCIGYIVGYIVSVIFLVGFAVIITCFVGKKRKQTLCFSICLGVVLLYLVGLSGGYGALRTVVDIKSCDDKVIALAIINLLVVILYFVFIIYNVQKRYPDTTDGDNEGEKRPLNAAH